MPAEFSLEVALRKRQKTAANYVNAYDALKTVFDTQIHPFVTAAAIAVDDIFLTDHGPEHVSRVINRASRLTAQSQISLSTYEIFILLVAIHLHDVGNALGRIGHEQNADRILELAYGPLGFDQLHKVMAIRVAAAHGGTRGGDRDTIRNIEERTNWRSEPIRPQYLAAVLRLADELAEDRHRANALAVALGTVRKSSEVHHVYASGVHSLEPDANSFTIDLKTAYSKSFFLRKLGKGTGEVYLLDEIYERTLKIYQEATYCSRYLRGGLRFDRVRVTIDIFDDGFLTRIKQITFVIEEFGYRLRRSEDIYRLSTELSDYEGNGRLTSDRLAAILGGADADAA